MAYYSDLSQADPIDDLLKMMDIDDSQDVEIETAVNIDRASSLSEDGSETASNADIISDTPEPLIKDDNKAKIQEKTIEEEERGQMENDQASGPSKQVKYKLETLPIDDHKTTGSRLSKDGSETASKAEIIRDTPGTLIQDDNKIETLETIEEEEGKLPTDDHKATDSSLSEDGSETASNTEIISDTPYDDKNEILEGTIEEEEKSQVENNQKPGQSKRIKHELEKLPLDDRKAIISSLSENGSETASNAERITDTAGPWIQDDIKTEMLKETIEKEERKSQKENNQKPRPSKPVKHELKKLPIDDHKDKILTYIERHRVICIQGETGSGKSTRVPQYIVQDYKRRRSAGENVSTPNIIITQPRRIAAKSLAKRVAQELEDRDVGGIVGYRMGREQEVTASTQVCFVTAGYLIEMLIHKPAEFNKYSHVIMDEIHERELDADLLSLMIHILMKEHLHPKLIIMSATLDAKLFLDYFGDLCEGASDRLLFVGVKSPYTVQTLYLEDVEEKLFKGCNLAKGAYDMLRETEGKFNNSLAEAERDKIWTLSRYLMLGVNLVQATAKGGFSILIFLPGVREIEEMYDLLYQYEKHKINNCKLLIFPLHSKIPFEDQQECFRVPDKEICHVILATNIAESSVTFPEISVIIDFGQRRHVIYDTKKRMSVLKLDWCSQASMDQRKGRTGRVCHGKCIRVMTESFFSDIRKFDEAQMKKAPLDKLFLRVKQVAKSIAPQSRPSEVLECAVEPPARESVASAIKNLADIGALSAEDELSDVTMLGHLCMALPVDLYLCRLVMFGVLLNKPCDALLMAASLQSQDPFTQPSFKILKNQDRFIKSQRRSYDARCRYDRGTYSQPIMLRNMLVDWFGSVDSENKRRKRLTKKAKHAKSLKDFRKEFTSKNSLDAKRLSLLEGIVVELAEKILRWIPSDDEARRKVEALIDKIPRRMKQFTDESATGNTYKSQAEHFISVGDLFTDDVLHLHMLLAASLVPKFVYGKVRDFSAVPPNYQGKNTMPRKTVEDFMNELGMNPVNTVCIFNPPNLRNDDIEDLILCISLEKDIDLDDDLFERHWKKYEMVDKKLFIEFAEIYCEKDIDTTIDVTCSVNRAICYVCQFTKEAMYEVSKYKEGAVKREALQETRRKQETHRKQETPFRFKPLQHPYRIHWELMCSDGNSLKEGNSSCEAFPEWRNPAGFMFDANQGIHIGLAAGITANAKGDRCWMEAFSALPTYKQNLYAVLLVLASLPHKHQVGFHIEKENMLIKQVTIFNYDIAIDKKYYPLTKRLMKIVNRIRAVTSEAFCGVDPTTVRKTIHATDLPWLYKLLIDEMEAQELDTDDLEEEYNEIYTPVVKVDGFYQDPNRQPIGDDAYLKPYNIELLFTKFALDKYQRRK